KAGRVGGLGLSMCHGIVKQHQGWVECRSAVGKGTTFDLYLPRWEEGKRLWPAAPPGRPGSGPPAVLVVEDHDLLRDLAGACLRRTASGAVTARDEAEAAALLGGPHPPPSAALLGVPAAEGGPLLAALRSLRPPCPVLVARSDPHAPPPDGVQGVVRKPYAEP